MELVQRHVLVVPVESPVLDQIFVADLE